MPEGLKHKTVKALAWNSAEKIGQQVIQSVITLILARLLFPADYGLVGMITIFMAIANSLLDSGFGQALIQKKNADQTDFSTVFYFNLAIGILLYALFFILAPTLARFYGEPRLTDLTRVMSLNIVINSFGMIQTTNLVKQLDFKTTTKAILFSSVISGGLGIFMAFRGYGVWSLAVQSTSGNLIQTGLLWMMNKWRPGRAFNLTSLRTLFAFGSRLLLSSLLQILDNVYNIIIGKVYSAIQLGYYSQAKRVQNIPVANITSILQRVTYPVMSSIQDEPERLKKNYRKIIRSAAFFNFPIMLWLIVSARLLFVFFLTSRWLPSVRFFQWLCLIGLTYPLNSLHFNIIKAKGRSDLFLNLEIAKKAILFTSIVLTIKIGIEALVIGQVVTHYLSLLITMHFSGRLIGYPLHEQFCDLLPTLIISAIAAAFSFLIPSIFNIRDGWLLLLQFAFSSGVYLALAKLFRFSAFLEGVEIIRKRVLSKV